MQVGLTLVTHFGMGMVNFTSSIWDGMRTEMLWNGVSMVQNMIIYGIHVVNEMGSTGME